MKCRSKLRYDCFYLTKDNIEEFLEWFSKYNIVNTYKKCNDYLEYVVVLVMMDTNFIIIIGRCLKMVHFTNVVIEYLK